MNWTYFYNGCIESMTPQQTRHEALLLSGNTIMALDGEAKSILKGLKDYKSIDLQGMTVLPGLIDAHLHLSDYAANLTNVNLSNAASIETTLAMLQKHTKQLSAHEWITGYGWNSNLWNDGNPHRRYLDTLFPDRPMALHSQDRHSLWVNTETLKRARLLKQSKTNNHTLIEYDRDGWPTGLIFEDKIDDIMKLIPPLSYNERKNGLHNAVYQLASYGITGVTTFEDIPSYRFYQSLWQKRELALNVCVYLPANALDTIIHSGMISGFGDTGLKFGGIKYFADGSLGSQTAELLEPYQGLGHNGVEVMTENDLGEQIRNALENGIGAAVHAIGDKANNKTLNVFQSLNNLISPQGGPRQRIEHAQIVHPGDIHRFREAGVIASIQPLQIAMDVKLADNYLGERAKNAYPIRTLMNLGVPVAFGSDAPVVEPNPWKSIYEALFRKYQLNPDEPTWNENETISLRQALEAYTRHAAFACYNERHTGSIDKGKKADFIVLNQNPFKANGSDILNISVLQTYINGHCIYAQEDWA